MKSFEDKHIQTDQDLKFQRDYSPEEKDCQNCKRTKDYDEIFKNNKQN